MEDRHYDVTLEAGDRFEGFLILHKTGEVEPAGAADPINSGGAGVVYRAQNDSGMEIALKLLSPEKKHVAKVDDIESFRATFEREIAVLSKVTHTRIAKIISSGTATLHGNSIPYYAMEFIDGKRLDEFLAKAEITGQGFLALVDQVLDGLEYLHRERIMHTDLKGENMLVRAQSGQLDAKIVDLGVAHVVDLPTSPAAETTTTDANGGTYFRSSPRITRPEWEPRLGTRITHAQLAEMFPSHDLYSIGAVLVEALAGSELRDRLGRPGPYRSRCVGQCRSAAQRTP